ncbi:DinB family protein [Pseudomonas sp. GV071]|uniref:DinB family protein n=1 Tax=Pseudomonas sp. GV071 TaxID=2135754 RepID=UPI000D36DFCA|nr:DinB family protein [Pseudomonas sp. GV071]PTQ70433.1 putative damage-inducible protein DinB [Pseudomonas sp. GV071]
MSRCDHLVLMAAYNAAMNDKLYAAAATLPTAQLMADRQAFFPSLFATLNHVVAGDIVWLKRFSEHPADFPALRAMAEISKPASLRDLLCSDLAELLDRRQQLDAIISAWAGQVHQPDLAHLLRYQNSQGIQQKPFGALTAHFFNHQTHHRGQATTLLFQAGIDVGSTDLLDQIPNQGL